LDLSQSRLAEVLFVFNDLESFLRTQSNAVGAGLGKVSKDFEVLEGLVGYLKSLLGVCEIFEYVQVKPFELADVLGAWPVKDCLVVKDPGLDLVLLSCASAKVC